MFVSSVTLRLIVAICCMVVVIQGRETIIAQIRPELNYRVFNDISLVPHLLQLRDEHGQFMCAGTLVEPKFVLTAADCLNRIDYSHVTIVAGVSGLKENGTQRKIAKVFKYPERHINVAVLRLNEPLNNFKPLPLGNKTVEDLNEDERIQVVGWRHLARRKSVTKELSYVKVDVASQPKCELQFYAAGTKRLFCLEGEGYENEPCVSDIGGPAMFDGTLIGVVSRGYKCGSTEHLTAVTELHGILNFIKKVMQ